MRFSTVKQKGSIVILMVIAIPLVVATLAAIVDLGQITLVRARLYAAADRAVYIGAATMADSMNRIAKQNWEINKAWRDLEQDFRENTQQNDKRRKEAINTFEGKYAAASEKIGEIQDAMWDRARLSTINMLTANTEGATGDIVGRGDVPISEDEDAGQTGKANYGEVKGEVFIDPEDVNKGSYSHTKYLTKPKGPDTTIGIFAEQTIRPMFFSRFFPNDFKVYAEATAQAFGGSVEDFALKETDSVEDAEKEVQGDGYDALYRAAIVPMWTLDHPRAEGKRH